MSQPGCPLLIHCKSGMRLKLPRLGMFSLGMLPPFLHVRLQKTAQFTIKTKGAIYLITLDFLGNTLKSLWQNGYSLYASSKDGQSCPKKLINLLCRGVEEQKAFQKNAGRKVNYLRIPLDKLRAKIPLPLVPKGVI